MSEPPAPVPDATARRAIVLLPGLDGTGRLLADVAAALAPDYDVAIIAYPTQEPLSYDALVAYVRQRLPQRPFLLLGESFSGPVALRLAAEAPPLLEAVVICASFARLDIALKPMLAALAGIVSPRLVPTALLGRLLAGGRAQPALLAGLRRCLSDVAAPVLAARLREALRVDLPAAGVAVGQPLLYLRATDDRLMPASAPDTVAAIARDMHITAIRAPHFLLQSEPARCADAIRAFDRERLAAPASSIRPVPGRTASGHAHQDHRP